MRARDHVVFGAVRALRKREGLVGPVEELDGDRVLRSVREEFQVPSVVRRREYINIRRRREASGMKRLRIYMRDHWRCH